MCGRGWDGTGRDRREGGRDIFDVVWCGVGDRMQVVACVGSERGGVGVVNDGAWDEGIG